MLRRGAFTTEPWQMIILLAYQHLHPLHMNAEGMSELPPSPSFFLRVAMIDGI